MKDHLP